MKTRKITFTTLSLTSIFVVCSFVNTSCATFKSYIPSLAITSFAPDFADKYDLDGNDISEY
jgi:predicted small secreted protein